MFPDMVDRNSQSLWIHAQIHVRYRFYTDAYKIWHQFYSILLSSSLFQNL